MKIKSHKWDNSLLRKLFEKDEQTIEFKKGITAVVGENVDSRVYWAT